PSPPRSTTTWTAMLSPCSTSMVIGSGVVVGVSGVGVAAQPAAYLIHDLLRGQLAGADLLDQVEDRAAFSLCLLGDLLPALRVGRDLRLDGVGAGVDALPDRLGVQALVGVQQCVDLVRVPTAQLHRLVRVLVGLGELVVLAVRLLVDVVEASPSPPAFGAELPDAPAVGVGQPQQRPGLVAVRGVPHRPREHLEHPSGAPADPLLPGHAASDQSGAQIVVDPPLQLAHPRPHAITRAGLGADAAVSVDVHRRAAGDESGVVVGGDGPRHVLDYVVGDTETGVGAVDVGAGDDVEVPARRGQPGAVAGTAGRGAGGAAVVVDRVRPAATDRLHLVDGPRSGHEA